MIQPDNIAFYIDGVVANTMGLFIEIARKDFNITHIKYDDITDYDLTKCLDLDFETVWNIIEKILSGNSDARLFPIKGSGMVLKQIQKQRKRLLFVTARPSAKFIENWIIKEFQFEPSQIKVFATGDFNSKTQILLDEKISYFVEDRIETCHTLNKCGIKPIVFVQPWNRVPHDFLEVNSWDELGKMIFK